MFTVFQLDATHLITFRHLHFTELRRAPLLGYLALLSGKSVHAREEDLKMHTSSTVVMPHSRFMQKPLSCQNGQSRYKSTYVTGISYSGQTARKEARTHTRKNLKNGVSTSECNSS